MASVWEQDHKVDVIDFGVSLPKAFFTSATVGPSFDKRLVIFLSLFFNINKCYCNF